MNFKTLTAIACAVVLAGCGSDSNPPKPHLAADLDWPVDAAFVQDLYGLDPPTFTVAEAYADQKRIVETGDSVLVSDLFVAPPEALPTRIQMNCAGGIGGACTFAYLGRSNSYGIEDLAAASPDYKTKYRSQEIGELGGIRFEQTVGKDTVLGNDADIRAGGGWMSHSGFAVQGALLPDGTWSPGAVSAGSATGDNPTGMGSATWIGMMVGIDLASPTGNPVAGNARITAQLAQPDPTVDVGFTNIKDLRTGTAHGDISWSGLALTAGGFRDGGDGNSIQGQLYGPEAEEVGGVFERNFLLGTFGAKQ